VLTTGLVLALYYYWFAIADRYAIFLYNHLGATPFDEVTRSRYWMAGLVAAGVVLVLYTAANWLLGRINRNYSPPAWWMVWFLGAPFLIAGIPLITMRLNQPVLPLSLALASLAAALIGLAMALAPGALAAQAPARLAWLVVDGAGLVPVLLLLWAVELPGRGLISVPAMLAVVGSSILAGIAWLLLATWPGSRYRGSWPPAWAVFLAGCCLSYLVMPLVHHLLFVPAAWRYISTARNFFALNPLVQLITLLVAAAMSVGISMLRRKLHPRTGINPEG
jgi:hypothetical protein